MTDPTNPNINPAPSNDETPAAYTGGTTADANQQDIEVTETFTTAMPQMPDLPPNPNGTMDDPYSADQQATTAMPNVAAHTANPYTQPATANTPQYGQPASNPYTQPAADQYAQPAADPYTQPSADPYGQQYAQPQYGQPAPGTPTYAAVPTGYIPRNKILAGLLALFFGALGIHNFYLASPARRSPRCCSHASVGSCSASDRSPRSSGRSSKVCKSSHRTTARRPTATPAASNSSTDPCPQSAKSRFPAANSCA